MTAAHLLVPSPLFGPRSWSPVAARLPLAAVPSLAAVWDRDPPYAPRVAEMVAAAAATLPNEPVRLVVHSGAGRLVPAIVEASPRPVAEIVFVEAALPARAGPTRAAPPQRLDELRAMAVGGLLPRWTDWWAEEEVAALFPDAQTRAAVSAEQVRLPLRFYEEPLPNPPAWTRHPCRYVLFSPGYAVVAQDARERGWPVTHLPGEHFHQLVDPAAVAAAITAGAG
ncbi:alpha/beta hydrolase [Dactylosporangium sp. NPDC051541]|uniref:alpha/beta hydrolase n=1 Tax=Dactylosporangium sp. NPDC051541 TaxID=3363977 RepID=UPI003797095E